MVDLYTRARGEKGPWLVMLHGLFGSGDNLGGLARLLELDYRILLVDLRNHGRSPHSSTMTYLEMAQDVFAAMDKESITQANIFGHSMGEGGDGNGVVGPVAGEHVGGRRYCACVIRWPS